MSVRTLKEVVEAYNYELWNKQNYALGEEIIADTVTRYYPGKTQTLTREESLQRVKDVFENLHSACEFSLPMLLVDGEYVTICWENRATPKTEAGKKAANYSSIEIFRVVNGQITEFWNPSYVEVSNGFWRQ